MRNIDSTIRFVPKKLRHKQAKLRYGSKRESLTPIPGIVFNIVEILRAFLFNER